MTSAPISAASEAEDRLAQFGTAYWEGRLAADPFEATLLGDHRFASAVPDPTPLANAQAIARLGELEVQVRALAPDGLSATGRVTRAALLGEIESEIASRTCAISDWAIDPRDGPHVVLQTLAQLTPVRTADEADALVTRWNKLGSYLDARVANLRSSARGGRVATRGSVLRVLAQLDELLAAPTAKSPLAAPGRGPLPGLSTDAKARFAARVDKAVDEVVRPGFARYRTVIRDEILPIARGDAHVGLDRIPDGALCYTRLIRVHTSLGLSPDEIHAIGLEENARIRAELSTLGSRLFGTRDVPTIQRKLRTDKALYFSTRDEVERKAEEALRRAERAMPTWFGRIARTPCEVVRVEPFEEKDTTIAYYRQPAVDGSRPGRYYINTFAPETRPRYEAEALAFHESVPGHHTQIALAMEAPGVPEFRRHLGVTSYVEGWALYTERLADEMGLYSGDLDRMGMLSFDAWRASRLVVDTGLHARGWSRQQAIDYMMANTALAANNVENEIDRYIGWPGQALAYKLGQREMFALRTEARTKLGGRFDIRAFHDEILRHGAVSLAVLRAEISRWLGTQTASAVSEPRRPQ